ncbi:hypothetical protein KKA33_00360 [Patescibacteria group bacterium]|nr:hypothetical protein [Patescibacteria group bacterium]
MKRRILLLTLMVFGLTGLTPAAMAAIDHEIQKFPYYVKLTQQQCQSHKAKNLMSSTLNGCEMSCAGDPLCLKACRKVVNEAFSALPACKAVRVAKPTIKCPKGTHETADKSHCECDEPELAGTFVTVGRDVDDVCMTKAELAAAEKARKDKADRLAALKNKKDREAYEAAKCWNAWHQAKLHPSEDGFADTCPDTTEKVACKTPDFPEVCLCTNCPESLRDDLHPSGPWVLKAGGNEECPSWFSYYWPWILGLALLLIVLAAVIFFFVTRRKKDDDSEGPGTPDAPTGSETVIVADDVPDLPPVDAQSYEALEVKLVNELTSAEEGGFLHPEHPFMKGALAALGALMVSKTDFDEALEAPPESLLDAIRKDLVRELARDIFFDLAQEHRDTINELTKQIDELKAQGEAADPAQLQILEIELRSYQLSLDRADKRVQALALPDEEDDS